MSVWVSGGVVLLRMRVRCAGEAAKGVYRVRNWPEYNAGLIERGNVTMWIDEGVLANPTASAARKRDWPCTYADAAIQLLLGLKQVFRLPLRALQGFAQSQRDLAFSGWPRPTTRH
jgi:hypothetical protein